MKSTIFASYIVALSSLIITTQASAHATTDDTAWYHRMTFSGGVNVAGFTSDHTPTTRGVIPSNVGDSPSASDINITFANLATNAKLADWMSAELKISYGQQSTGFIRSAAGGGNIFVDNASVTFANAEHTPFYLTAGRQFVGFGGLDRSSYLESPYQLFTLNRQTLVAVGFKDWSHFDGSIYAFHGLNHNTLTNTTRINTYGVAAAYTQDKQSRGFQIGAGYISNFVGALYPSSTTASSSTLSSGSYHAVVPAIEVHANAHCHNFDVNAKYAGTVKRASVLDIPFTTNSGTSLTGAEPAVWGVNGGYSFRAFSRHSRVGVGYQGSSEAVALGTVVGAAANTTSGVYGSTFAIGMPEQRYYTNYMITLVKWASVGLEYAHDIGYRVVNGGTGRASNIGVAMLSAKF